MPHLPRVGIMRTSMYQLLAAIVLLIIGYPFFYSTAISKPALSALFSLMYVLALLAVGGHRKTLVQGSLLLAPALAARWCNEYWPGIIPDAFNFLLTMSLLGYVIFHLFYFITRAPRVNKEVICAGISTYLMLAIFWAVAYMFASEIYPNSFLISGELSSHAAPLDFLSSLYFSFITLLTVGYGDIVPRHPISRTLACTEAATGCFFIALLIARLVAQYSSEKNKPIN